MRKQSRVSFGPGAASLILIVVILSMSVLGILSLMSARSDSRLSDRSAQVVEASYALMQSAEHTLSELDELALSLRAQASDDESYAQLFSERLPANVTLEEGVLSWEETDGVRTLECAVELMPLSSQQRLVWMRHSLSAVTEEIWN